MHAEFSNDLVEGMIGVVKLLSNFDENIFDHLVVHVAQGVLGVDLGGCEAAGKLFFVEVQILD